MISEAKIKLVFALGAFFILIGCQKKVEPSHIVGRTMGTTYSIKYYSTKTKPDIKQVNKEVNRLLIEVNRQMSTYIPTSEISRFNREIKSQTAFPISDDFYFVLKKSLEISRKTGGQFDPTIGPLVNLWGFGPNGVKKVPTEAQIKKAKSRVGFEKLSLDSQNKRISKSIDNLYLDLSASAKGFGVDKISQYLETLKIENYMVEIGGEVRTKGSKGEAPWRIAIEAPHPTDQSKPFQKILDLNEHAVATSGNYRNYFEKNGKKFGHTIDFRTGRPTEHTLASVSVITKASCTEADALATALMVMGPLKALKFAELNGIKALFVYKLSGQTEGTFVEESTSHFKKEFRL
ncbi:MAG: FAD:protein FMN transferase ApbE [Halobacteriovorax sp.]|nr:FAD:protein FMN transferase ApbE [Halobacteriovorax sp.]|tara:strand:+ start:26655 stop:27698 length:1044 start_codon:yes stop_codon:yes gene_type:complete